MDVDYKKDIFLTSYINELKKNWIDVNIPQFDKQENRINLYGDIVKRICELYFCDYKFKKSKLRISHNPLFKDIWYFRSFIYFKNKLFWKKVCEINFVYYFSMRSASKLEIEYCWKNFLDVENSVGKIEIIENLIKNIKEEEENEELIPLPEIKIYKGKNYSENKFSNLDFSEEILAK